MTKFSEELKRLMKRENVSVTEICLKNPIQSAAIYSYRSHTIPSDGAIEVLAKALHEPIKNLLAIAAEDRMAIATEKDKKELLGIRVPTAIKEESVKEELPKEEVKKHADRPAQNEPEAKQDESESKHLRRDIDTCAEILRCNARVQMNNAMNAKSHLDFTMHANLAWAETVAAEIISRG